MFHEDISEGNREKLKIIKEIIEKSLGDKEFEFKRVQASRSITTDILGEHINCIELFFTKDNVKYLISLEILN